MPQALYSGHPLDFTFCTWHPQVNKAKEVLISTQMAWFLISVSRISPADFQTQHYSFQSMNQQLKKVFRNVSTARLPVGRQGPVTVLEKPSRYLHLFWGLLQGWGTRLWRSCQPDPALMKGALLACGGGATKSNQVITAKVHLSSSAVLIIICMLFPGFFAVICGSRQKNSKGFLGW